MGKTSNIYFVRTMTMHPYSRQGIPFVNVFFALKRKIEPRMDPMNADHKGVPHITRHLF
jgi:hypothetical protein